MIVILGSGRSGTSFLAKLFDSHPAVLYRHEPDSVFKDPELPANPPADVPDEVAERAGRYLRDLVAVRHPKTAVLPFFPKAYRGPVRQWLHQGTAFVHKTLARPSLSWLADRLRIPDLIDPGRRGGIVPVIKSVDSLCRAQAFVRADPAVRVVHILRHPCGVIASRLRGVKKGLMQKNTGLRLVFSLPVTETYGITPEEMEAAADEERMALQWMAINDKVWRELEGHPQYSAVIYEKLCLDTEGETRRLFDFAGLDYHDATARFIGELGSQAGGRPGYFSIMRPPRSALEVWKKDLTPEQVGRIRAIVSRGTVSRFFPDLVGEEGAAGPGVAEAVEARD